MSPDRFVFAAMGTRCELLSCAGGDLGAGAAWVGAAASCLTPFSPDSELSRFNLASGWVPVSPLLEGLLREALRAYSVSGGLVDAGVVTLEIRPGLARTRAPIDPCGIAKGWLADRLVASGLLGSNCLVNLGGDLFARGDGPDGAGWPVGFGSRTVMLRDLGAATSGTTRRGAHLRDPRTGRPATSGLAEVSVVAASAADAEIFAKTAFLLGSTVGRIFLNDRGALAQRFLAA